MGPLWAPEQHTLAFRSNAPTSAHPGQTKSLCAASPLPPRPAPSTDVAPPPPPGGSPGRQPPEYGGRDVAVGTVTSPNGEHRVQPRAGDTALSRAASPCGSDGTAGPGIREFCHPCLPVHREKGSPCLPPAPDTERHAWHGSSSGPGTDVARWGGRRGQRGGALRVPAPQPRCRALGSGAARCAPCGRAPGPPRGTHLADGTAEALGPAHLPTQRSELHPGLYTAPVAAHPSQIVPLLFPAPQVCPVPLAVPWGQRTAPRPRPVLSFPPRAVRCRAGDTGLRTPPRSSSGRRWSFPTPKFNGKKRRGEKQTASVNH